MKRKTKKVPKKGKSQIGTRVLGVVSVNYVQFGVPDKYAVDIADALAQVIMRDYPASLYKNGQDDDGSF
jgi:hypothetical protein